MQTESLPTSRRDSVFQPQGAGRRPRGLAVAVLSVALLLSGCMGSDRTEKPELEGQPEASKVSPETIQQDDSTKQWDSKRTALRGPMISARLWRAYAP